MIQSSVLAKLSTMSQNAIYNDEKYGLDTPIKLYKWTQAMKGGGSSEMYLDILTHFGTTLALPDFGQNTMEQIVGDHSLMYILNTTFTYNVGHEMHYTGNLVELKDFIRDQWGARKITNNLNINLTADGGLIDSVFDLYSEVATKIPDSYGFPGFQPELNYFLAETLHLLDDDINFSSSQLELMFDTDISNY